MTGTVYNIIPKYSIKNGGKCYLDLKKCFLIKSHDKNKAQRSEKSISDVLYIGEMRNFTIEIYYGIVTKSLNYLYLM